MRVLFVDQFTEWGGAQIGLRDVAIEGKRRGWAMWLLAPGEGPLRGFCAANSIDAGELPLTTLTNGRKTASDALRFVPDTLRCALSIRRLVRRNRIDVVIANGPRVLPAAVLAAGCPVIFHAHSRPDKRYARAILRLFSKRVARIVAVSQFTGQFSDAALIVYNGVEDHGFVQRPLPPGNRTVAIVGRIAPEKGHLAFVRAARLIAQSHAGTKFLIVGTGMFSHGDYEEQVRREAEGLEIEFRGWVDDVGASLRNVSVLAVPSSGIEAATRVIPEAFSAGIPVVAYRSGGIPELVRDGENGVLTEARNHQSLALAIGSLLDDPDRMARFSRTGRRDWQARFQLAQFQRDICNLIEETAAPGGAPPSVAAAGQLNEGPPVITGSLRQ